MSTSIRDRIKSANDITKKVVTVPEWDDVEIEIRSMSGRARAHLLKAAAQSDGTMDYEKLYPAILIACCFDPESGEPLFTADDSEWLNDKSAGPVEMIAQAGMLLSGLNREAVDNTKGLGS